MPRSVYLLLASIVVLRLAFACDGKSGASDGPADGVERLASISSPLGVHASGVSQVAWVGDWLVFEEGDTRGGEVAAYDFRLWKVRPNGSEMSRLPLRESCGSRPTPFAAFRDPIHFGEGALGFVTECALAREGAPNRPGSVNYLFSILDLNDPASIAQFYTSFPESTWFSVKGLALNRIDGWMMTTRGRTNDIIYRQSLLKREDRPDGEVTETFTVPMTQIWSLASSPDGRSVSFLGYNGDRSEPTAFIEGQLYIAEPDFTNIRPLGEKFGDMRGTPWSPDGCWILVSGVKDQTRGLWIISTSTGEARLAGRGQFGVGPSAWSPDGTKVAVRNDDHPGKPAVIAVFDLTTILD